MNFLKGLLFLVLFIPVCAVLFIMYLIGSIAEFGRDYKKQPMTREEWKGWTF